MRKKFITANDDQQHHHNSQSVNANKCCFSSWLILIYVPFVEPAQKLGELAWPVDLISKFSLEFRVPIEKA